MGNVILRTNAIPVYGFLSVINAQHPPDETRERGRILDCGAGGSVPPLALFHRHGFETWGIDVSEEQLDRARQFCVQQEIDVHLRAGDMRQLPFDDESFDYVFEHYSMLHLSKGDTARAIGEMYRVLKPKGLCFLGFMSTHSWPHSWFGEEREPGELWAPEGGDDLARHTMFSDREASELVSGWEIINRELQTRYTRGPATGSCLEDWMAQHGEPKGSVSREEWLARYASRAGHFLYAHLYFVRLVVEQLPCNLTCIGQHVRAIQSGPGIGKPVEVLFDIADRRAGEEPGQIVGERLEFFPSPIPIERHHPFLHRAVVSDDHR